MPTGKSIPLACRKNITRYCFSWSGFHSYFWNKILPFSIYRNQNSVFLHLSSPQELWLQQSSPAVHCLSPRAAEVRSVSQPGPNSSMPVGTTATKATSRSPPTPTYKPTATPPTPTPCSVGAVGPSPHPFQLRKPHTSTTTPYLHSRPIGCPRHTGSCSWLAKLAEILIAWIHREDFSHHGLGVGLGHLEQPREGHWSISKLSLILSIAFLSDFPQIYYEK